MSGGWKDVRFDQEAGWVDDDDQNKDRKMKQNLRFSPGEIKMKLMVLMAGG